jgi:putative oxidoreductase
MLTFLSRLAPQTYALLRIVAGLLFLFHGTQKLLGWPAASHGGPPLVVYGAGGIELIGGLLICIGFLAPWAALISSGEMAVAYWWKHGSKDPFPINNGGELATLYCFVFLCIAAHGAGIWSLDAWRRARAGGSM